MLYDTPNVTKVPPNGKVRGQSPKSPVKCVNLTRYKFSRGCVSGQPLFILLVCSFFSGFPSKLFSFLASDRDIFRSMGL